MAQQCSLSTWHMSCFEPGTEDLGWVIEIWTFPFKGHGLHFCVLLVPVAGTYLMSSDPLGTSFSALGSHLFGVWNVLFWFWVKPQEKGFYFWNAHFQLYIPLDGIRFSGIGVCTNGILSHVSSLAVEKCCFIWERVVLWSVNSISCPSHAACFGCVARKGSASKDIRDMVSELFD